MLLLSILINKKGCNFLLSKNVHYMRIIIFFLIFKKYYSHLYFQSLRRILFPKTRSGWSLS